MRLGTLFGLVFCLYGTAQMDVPPDAAEQARIVAVAEQYASTYQPPDVAFDRTITEFRKEDGTEEWRKKLTLYTNRFSHGGVEYWRYGQKNGKPAGGAQWRRAGFPREHDSFAAMLKGSITWDRWDLLRGRRTAVLTYHVLQRDSQFAINLCIRDCKGDPKYVPYSGSLYVDPATGSIWRLSEIVDGDTVPSPFRNSMYVCDFDRVRIGGEQYTVVTSWFSVSRGRGGFVRYLFEDANFHKFEADSSVTYEK